MKKTTVSRRDFLSCVAALGAAGSVLSACGGGSGEDVADAGGRCSDLTGLAPQEVQVRQTLQYVSQSPYPEKVCNNCRFWQESAEGDFCGGCQLIKGPINPEGYCASWVAAT